MARNIDGLYYDENAKRMLVTSKGPGTDAFAVAIPSMRVTTWDTGLEPAIPAAGGRLPGGGDAVRWDRGATALGGFGGGWEALKMAVVSGPSSVVGEGRSRFIRC